jgi:hypothetical protein
MRLVSKRLRWGGRGHRSKGGKSRVNKEGMRVKYGRDTGLHKTCISPMEIEPRASLDEYGKRKGS